MASQPSSMSSLVMIMLFIMVMSLTTTLTTTTEAAAWSSWSACSALCSRTAYRTRTCDPIDGSCTGASIVPCWECVSASHYSNYEVPIATPVGETVHLDLDFPTSIESPYAIRVHLDGASMRSNISLTYFPFPIDDPSNYVTVPLVRDELRSYTESIQYAGLSTTVASCSDITMRRVTFVDPFMEANKGDYPWTYTGLNRTVVPSLTTQCYGGTDYHTAVAPDYQFPYPYLAHTSVSDRVTGGSFTGFYQPDPIPNAYNGRGFNWDIFTAYTTVNGTWRLSVTNQVQLGWYDRVAYYTPLITQWGITVLYGGCPEGWYGGYSTPDCAPCPSGMTAGPAGSYTEFANCQCITGFTNDTASGTCVDPFPPVITCPLDITRTVYSGDWLAPTYTWTAPIVTDGTGAASANITYTGIAISNGDIDTNMTIDDLGPFAFPIGTTIVTYTATNTMNLSSSCSFIITVIAASPPTCAVPSLPTPPGVTHGSTLCSGNGYHCQVSQTGGIHCWNLGGYDPSVSLVPTDFNYIAVTCGNQFACALTKSATVVCWGPGLAETPAATTSYHMIAAGFSHMCAITTSGSIDCFGVNLSGETVPPSRNDWVQVAAGYGNTCGLTNLGEVICWGASFDYNKVSYGDTPTGYGWKYITVKLIGACAIDAMDQSYCWGVNNQQTVLVGMGAYSGVQDVVSIVVGEYATLMLHSTGNITAWGVYGGGKGADPFVPEAWVASDANRNITRITTGGAAWCVGYDNPTSATGGQSLLCSNAASSMLRPAYVPPTIVDVVVGARGWTCTLSNQYSTDLMYLNDEGIVTCYNGPSPADSSYRFKSVRMWQASHACGQLMDGRVHCWAGLDISNCPTTTTILQDLGVAELVISTPGLTSWPPSDLSSIDPTWINDHPYTEIINIAVGVCSVCVLVADPPAEARWGCWGDVMTYGDGSVVPRLFPALYPTIVTTGDWPRQNLQGSIEPPFNTTFTGDACMGGRATVGDRELWFQQRHHHLCTLLSTGDIYCSIRQAMMSDTVAWGHVVKAPVTKPAGTVFTSVSCGESHVCGLLSDGTHYCEDVGKFNDLGSDSSVTLLLNQQSSSVYGTLQAISTHTDNACGVKYDGTITCWGLPTATFTQLGVIPPMNIFERVVVGASHICGYGMHSIMCWGSTNFQAGPAFEHLTCSSSIIIQVSSTGSDGTFCGGTITGMAPCATIAGALEISQLTSTFMTIAIDGGNYVSSSEFSLALIGTVIRPLSISEGGNTAVPVVLNVSSHAIVVAIDQIQFESIVFTGSNAITAAVIINEQITGVTFTNCQWSANQGTSAVGQAVRMQLRSAVSFVGCTWSNNKGGKGSAIYAQFATISLESCTFTSNTAISEGGTIYSLNSDIVVTDTSFTSGSGAVRGGAILALFGSVTLTNSNFTANSASKGGAIYANGGVTLSITSCTFTANIGRVSGAALQLETNTIAAVITSSSFINNIAATGGAVLASDTSVTVHDSVFMSNQVTDNGGAVSCVQTGTSTPVINITSSTFFNHIGTNGAVLSADRCTMIASDASAFIRNRALSNGGILYLTNGAHATVQGCALNGNTAVYRGGVVATSSSIFVCIANNITQNTALAGAVYFDDELAVTASNNVYTNNIGGYGTNEKVTAAPTALLVTSAPSVTASQQSGAVLSPIILRFFDILNSAYYTAGSSESVVATSSNITLRGATSVVMDSTGTATFDALIAVAPVGGPYVIYFSATVTALDGVTTILMANISLTFSSCAVGYQRLDNICVLCDQGKYSQSIDATECTACEIGKYGLQNGTAPATCEPCSAGQYQSNTGQLACDACPAGRWGRNLPQQTECFECSIGRAAITTGSIGECPICSTGTYSSVNGSVSCTKCGAGTYMEIEGSSQPCKPCNGSTYQALEGQASCGACLLGSYSVTTGAPIAACTTARPGFFVNTTGATTSIRCTPGSYSSTTGASACTLCDPGYYLASSQGTACIPATYGYYVPNNGSTGQLPCQAGTYSQLNAPTCTPCANGSYSGSAAAYCNPCVAGSYQPAGSSKGLDSCVTCSAGTAASSEGVTVCDTCSAGSYSGAGATVCKTCAHGTISTAGAGSCTTCDAGTATDTNSTQCVACVVGTYSTASSSICVNASVGYYVDHTSASTQTACVAGTSQPLTGRSSCIDCDTGKYSDGGAETCTNAPAGTYVGTTRANASIPCAAGSYSSLPGSTICLLCDKGYYAPTTGLSSCLACVGASVASAQGLSACAACPEHSSALENQCQCEINFYAVTLPFNGTYVTTCYVCPSGTSCTTSGSTAAAIQLNAATWKLVAADGTVSTAACPGDRCIQGNCSANRKPADENVLCGACINEDYSEWGGNCVYCKDSNVGYVFGVVLVSLIYVAFLIRAAMGNSSSHTKIFSYFLSTARFMLNDQLQFLQWLGIFDFSPDRGNGGTCVTPLTPYGQMGMQAAVALLFFVDLFVIALVDWLVYKIRVRCFKQKLEPYAYNHYFRAFIAILLFSYTSITDVVFTYLNCYDVGDKYRVVWKYPAISCYDSRYKSWFGVVVLGLVFPVIGLPVILIFAFLGINKRYKGIDWRTQFRARFGILYETYKPNIPWWEAAALIRRTSFVVIAWALFNAPRSRYLGFNLANMSFLLIHLWVQPFGDPICNKLESMSLFALTVLAALLAGATDVTTTNVDISVWLQVLITFTVLPPLLIFAFVIFIRKLGRSIPCLRGMYLRLASDAERRAILAGKSLATPRDGASGAKAFPPNGDNTEDAAFASPRSNIGGGGGTSSEPATPMALSPGGIDLTTPTPQHTNGNGGNGFLTVPASAQRGGNDQRPLLSSSAPPSPVTPLPTTAMINDADETSTPLIVPVSPNGTLPSATNGAPSSLPPLSPAGVEMQTLPSVVPPPSPDT